VKVLMLLDNPFDNDSRVEKEAKSLVDAGYDVTIVGVTHPDLPQEEDRNGYHITRKFSDPIIKNPLRSGYRSYVSQTGKELATLDYDILHCHDYHVLRIASEVKKLRPNEPLVYDAHEYLAGYLTYLTTPSFMGKVKGYVVWRWQKIIERKNIKHADAVMTTTASLVEMMRERFNLNVPMTHLENVPNIFPLTDKKLYHDHFGIPHDKKIIMHSGNMYCTMKEWDTYVQAAATVDDLYTLIMWDERSKPFREVAKARGMEDRILFHSYVPANEVGTYMSSADMGLLFASSKWLSQWYASSTKIMEYTLAGLPIVSINQPEVVKIGQRFGHMINFSTVTVTGMRKCLLECVARIDELHNNALKSRGSMSWDDEASKLIDLYRELEPKAA